MCIPKKNCCPALTQVPELSFFFLRSHPRKRGEEYIKEDQRGTQKQYQRVSPPSKHENAKTYTLILLNYELLYYPAYKYNKKKSIAPMKSVLHLHSLNIRYAHIVTGHSLNFSTTLSNNLFQLQLELLAVTKPILLFHYRGCTKPET